MARTAYLPIPADWAGVIDRAEARRVAVVARSYLYGVVDPALARLFTAGSTEIAFAEGYTRVGYEALDGPSAVPGWIYQRDGVAFSSRLNGALSLFAEDVPRITDRGLGVERAVTNLLLHSHDLTTAAWVKNGVTISYDSNFGADTSSTADKVVEQFGIGGTKDISQIVTVAAGKATFSVYARAAERKYIGLQTLNDSVGTIAWFDVEAGTIGTTIGTNAPMIERLGNGLFRCLVTVTVAAGAFEAKAYLAAVEGVASYVGDTDKGAWLWGAQVENAIGPGTYVRNDAIVEEKAADGPRVAWTPPSGFTVFVEAELEPTRGEINSLVSLTGANEFDGVTLLRNPADDYILQVASGGTVVSQTGVYDPGRRIIRAALSVSGNRTSACFDGGVVLSIDKPRPEGLDTLWLGAASETEGTYLNGYIRALLTRDRASTDDELQAMTAPPAILIDTQEAVRQELIAHDHDLSAHELGPLRGEVDALRALSGIWSVVAADTFTGANGVLTSAETGGQAWNGDMQRVGGVAKKPDNSLGGSYLNAGFSDGQVEADLAPGNGEASLYFRFKPGGDYLMFQRGGDGSAGLKRVVGGATTNIGPIRYLNVEAGERWKVRLVAARIWVFRVVRGVEELIYDVVESQWQTETCFGVRTNGTGSVDNFRVFGREAL